jgi:hypothetical protein
VLRLPPRIHSLKEDRNRSTDNRHKVYNRRDAGQPLTALTAFESLGRQSVAVRTFKARRSGEPFLGPPHYIRRTSLMAGRKKRARGFWYIRPLIFVRVSAWRAMSVLDDCAMRLYRTRASEFEQSQNIIASPQKKRSVSTIRLLGSAFYGSGF